MTQDEQWLDKYNEVKDIEKNYRTPSRYITEERGEVLQLD